MDGFWQEFEAAFEGAEPYVDRYPARMPDGRILVLPIRELPAGLQAVASFIANQASFGVIDDISVAMASLARELGAEIIVGLPTLGLAFAPVVARLLGHANFVACGYSRKFWYDDAHSVPISSITSPGANQKRLYLDPLIMPRLRGRRIVIVDDVASSGKSLRAATQLLEGLGLSVSGCVVAMRQGTVFEEAPSRPVLAAFRSPRFVGMAGRWYIDQQTAVVPGAPQRPV